MLSANAAVPLKQHLLPFALVAAAAPNAPGSLTATGAMKEIDLHWVDNGGMETLFKIERRLQTQVANAYTQIGFVGASATGYADTTALPAMQYVYRIRSTNGPLDSNYSNETPAAMLAIIVPPGGGNPGGSGAPNAPSALTAVAAVGEVDIHWVDNGGTESLFKIERHLLSQGANAYVQVGYVGANATSYADKSAVPATQYIYRIRSSNGPVDSAYSNEAPTSAGTPGGGGTGGGTGGTTSGLSAPTGLLATVNAAGVALQWTLNSSSQTGLKIERRLQSQGANGYTQIGYAGGTTTAWSDPTAAVGVQYVYRIRVTNGGSDSGYSNEAATVAAPVIQSAGLRVSADGRYLVNADGSAFTWVADTAWRLFNVPSRADADLYLQDRANKGFTVIQAVLVNDSAPKNFNGQSPFINNDPAKPNPAYFTYVDTLVSDAKALGLTLAISPAWCNKVAGPDHQIFTAVTARSFGQYLGSRYKGKNIIWMLGGDAHVNTYQASWDGMADGLNAGSGGANLVTFHPRGGLSSSNGYANDPRVQFNMLQSGHSADSANYDMIAADYALSPAKPTIDGEANYEEIPNNLGKGTSPITAYDVRKKAYWSLFAGAFGVTYGDMNVYQFWTPTGAASDFPTAQMTTWKDALDAPGARQMQFIKKLIQSRPILSRIPDQSLITSASGTGTDHVQATRDANGSYAMVYTASGQPVWVDMTKLSGTVIANWYNPRDGSYTAVGSYDNTGVQAFTPPSSGAGNDWVLVLDDASKGYPVK